MNEDYHYGYIAHQLRELALECDTTAEKKSYVRALRDLLKEIDSLERERTQAECEPFPALIEHPQDRVDPPSGSLL